MGFPKHPTSLKGFAKGSPKSQLAVFCIWKLTNCCGIIESTNVDTGSGSHPQLVGLRMAKASHPASPLPGGDAMQKNLKQTRRSDFGSITVLSDLSYHIVYILYIYKYIYQSIEAWGMWSFLEVSTSSTGSRMDPHSFIVCMRKVRETELEAATVCPAAVSNKS